MTSARQFRPKRARTLTVAIAALVAPLALMTNLHGRAAAESTARHAARHAAGNLSTPLSVDWRFTGTYFSSNPASPVLSSDTAYFTSGNAVYAVALDTGAQKWRYPSEPTAYLSKLVIFTPTLHNNVLYVAAPDGLYALNATDGKQLWRYAPAGKVQVVSTPIIIENIVYFICQNGRMYAIDATSGEPVTGAYKLPNRQEGIDVGGDLAAEPTQYGNELYYVTASSELHARNIITGVNRWTVHLVNDITVAKPVFYGDGFYLAQGNTFASWKTNGQTRWQIPLPTDVAVPPVVDEAGNAYVVLSDRNVYCINSHGKGVWKQGAHLDNRALTQPVITGNLLIITTALGGVSAFDTATGLLKWNYRIIPSSEDPENVPAVASVTSRPVVQGDTLYALSDDGSLTAFRHDAIDKDAPAISKIEPENGDSINGRPPVHISAHLVDEGSGLDLSTLTLKLDDQTITRRLSEEPATSVADNGFVFKKDISTLDYTTLETEGGGKSSTLTDGHHTITVTVKDWKGNQLTKTWGFLVDDTIKRVRKSDTQSGPGGRGGLGGKNGGGGGPGGK